MPSQLIGLMRRLTWSDSREVQKPAPGPGEFVTAAETKTDVPPRFV